MKIYRKELEQLNKRIDKQNIFTALFISGEYKRKVLEELRITLLKMQDAGIDLDGYSNISYMTSKIYTIETLYLNGEINAAYEGVRISISAINKFNKQMRNKFNSETFKEAKANHIEYKLYDILISATLIDNLIEHTIKLEPMGLKESFNGEYTKSIYGNRCGIEENSFIHSYAMRNTVRKVEMTKDTLEKRLLSVKKQIITVIDSLKDLKIILTHNGIDFNKNIINTVGYLYDLYEIINDISYTVSSCGISEEKAISLVGELDKNAPIIRELKDTIMENLR